MHERDSGILHQIRAKRGTGYDGTAIIGHIGRIIDWEAHAATLPFEEAIAQLQASPSEQQDRITALARQAVLLLYWQREKISMDHYEGVKKKIEEGREFGRDGDSDAFIGDQLLQASNHQLSEAFRMRAESIVSKVTDPKTQCDVQIRALSYVLARYKEAEPEEAEDRAFLQARILQIEMEIQSLKELKSP